MSSKNDIWAMMSKEELEEKIKELESIPLFDIHGGKQRSNKDNENLIKFRCELQVLMLY